MKDHRESRTVFEAEIHCGAKAIFLMERLDYFIADGLISLMSYGISEKALLYFMSWSISFSLERVSPSFQFPIYIH